MAWPGFNVRPNKYKQNIKIPKNLFAYLCVGLNIQG